MKPAQCKRCPLFDVQHNCIMGDGPSNPKIVFVGEAPGATEDEEGLPFIGRSGQLLRSTVADANEEGIPVKFTNVVRCRPPDNRPPETKEIKKCLPFLRGELLLDAPKLTVCLGGTATKALLNKSGIERSRGRVIRKDGKNYLVTYHPAARALKEERYWNMFVDDIALAFDFVAAPEIVCPLQYEVISPEACLAYLKNFDAWTFDIEATTLDPWSKDARVVCISFTAEEHVSKFVWFDKKKREVFREIFALPAEKTTQGKYDSLYLPVVEKIQVQGWDWDTMLMSYCLNVNEPRSLEYMTDKYLPDYRGYKAQMREELASRKLKQKASEREMLGMEGVPPDILIPYNAKDTATTFLLRNRYHEQIEDAGQLDYYRNVLHPATKHLVEVEKTGCVVDLKYAYELSRKLDTEIRLHRATLDKHPKMRKYLQKHDVEEINLNSPAQVRSLLFDFLGLEPISMTKKTKLPSTKAKELERIDHPIVQSIIKISRLRKLRSTFTGEAVESWIHDDGLVHSEFNIDTRTGRLSSGGPNLQQMPRKSTSGEEFNIKRMFISRFKGGSILSPDYSQIELRVFASLANCKRMLKVYDEDGDIHAAAASAIWGVAEDKVDEALRADAKRVNFGILYWETEKGLQYNHGKTLDYWKKTLRKYYDMYPEIEGFREQTIEFLRKHDYVESPFRSRRHFPGYRVSRDKWYRASCEREACNQPIQNAASLICLTAGMRMASKMRKLKMRSVIFNYVHDQILFDVHPAEAGDLPYLVKEELERPVHKWMKTKILVDMAMGDTWGTTKKLTL